MHIEHTNYLPWEYYVHYFGLDTVARIVIFTLISIAIFLIFDITLKKVVNHKRVESIVYNIFVVFSIIYAAAIVLLLFLSSFAIGPLVDLENKHKTWIDEDLIPHLESMPLVKSDNVFINEIELIENKDVQLSTVIKDGSKHIEKNIISYNEDLPEGVKPFVTYRKLEDNYGIQEKGLYDITLHLPKNYILDEISKRLNP